MRGVVSSVPGVELQQIGQRHGPALGVVDRARQRCGVQRLEELHPAGMQAYEAGGLDNGIVVEGLTALIIAMNKRYKSKVGGVRVSGINKEAPGTAPSN